MAAVTQLVPNFLGGVSKQTDKKKKPGQVRECLNAYPDPTFGLRKRPGLKFIKSLHTSSDTSSPDFADAKWFFIKRDNNETYIGCILNSTTYTTNPIRIWRSDGTVCTVTYPDGVSYLDTTKDNYDVLTVQDNSVIVNKTKVVGKQPVPTNNAAEDAYILGDKATVRLYQVKYSCTYKVTVKIDGTDYTAEYTTIEKEAVPPAGPNGELVNTAEKILSELKSDLDALSPPGTLTTTQLEATLELSFVTPTVTATPTGNGTGNGTDATLTNLATTTGGSGTGLTVDVVISGGVATNITVNTGGKDYAKDDVITISKSLIPGTGTGSTIDDDVTTTIASLNAAEIEISSSDNQGNATIKAFGQQVNVVADLPADSVHNRLVKIVNSKDGRADDTYWSIFVAENEVSGAGYWKETIDPTVSPGMDSSTLPHQLFNNASNSFIFRKADWINRKVGDENTNLDPSFVGFKIQQAFFYNNRLGLLSKDNVSMSKSNNFYDFYHSTALTQTDSDPIDINCSSIRPAVLHAIIPTAQGLVLFSKNQQYMLFSDSEILTPKSAVIRSISNYEMDSSIDPVDVGTTINFVSKTPSYSRVFGMQTRGFEESPLVHDISKVISEWLPDTVTDLLTSPQNELIALYGSLSNTLYLHKTYSVGQEVLMQSWFKWDLPGNIQHASVDSDTLWSVIEKNGEYNLVSASLTQTPEETIMTTADGKQINPHMDMYTAATNGLSGGSEKKVVYDTAGDFSKCYIPYSDLTNLNPVILIAGNATQDFAGVTEYGFTVSPTRATDSDGTYFKVERKDLSSQAANVYVGYQYNYDVELPTTYFNRNPEGTVKDYTATLTIARMKFAVGLSSVVGFKVKSKGYRGELAEFTGDGSTTAFSVPFPLKEENGIVVKLDGAKQASTAYSVTTTDSQATVTFNNAPTAASTAANVTTPAQKIEITTDTWYDVQPVKEADQYLADDVPLSEEEVYTVPLHQRTDNFNLRVFSNSPFPLSLTSMVWEGNYSPRFYRRT